MRQYSITLILALGKHWAATIEAQPKCLGWMAESVCWMNEWTQMTQKYTYSPGSVIYQEGTYSDYHEVVWNIKY